MSQTSLKMSGVSQQTPADVAHKQLEVEKVGVILGFLLGLTLSVGVVSDELAVLDANQAVQVVAGVVVTALCTALGLRAGRWLADRFDH